MRGRAEQIVSLRRRGSTGLMLWKAMDLLFVLWGEGSGMLKTLVVC